MEITLKETLQDIDLSALKPKRKAGRPRLLTPDQADIVRILDQKGFSAASIAKLFGISQSALYVYLSNKHG